MDEIVKKNAVVLMVANAITRMDPVTARNLAGLEKYAKMVRYQLKYIG